MLLNHGGCYNSILSNQFIIRTTIIHNQFFPIIITITTGFESPCLPQKYLVSVVIIAKAVLIVTFIPASP